MEIARLEVEIDRKVEGGRGSAESGEKGSASTLTRSDVDDQKVGTFDIINNNTKVDIVHCSGLRSLIQSVLPRQISHLRYTLIMSGANLNASTSTTSSPATTITPRTSPSPRETQNGRFASLSPSKPGGLVRRPSLARQTTVTPGAGGVATSSSAADRRRSLVNGAGVGVEGVKSPGELTVFVSRMILVAHFLETY